MTHPRVSLAQACLFATFAGVFIGIHYYGFAAAEGIFAAVILTVRQKNL